MRCMSVLLGIVVFAVPALAQTMPQVDAYYDTASNILSDRMELAEDHLDYGRAACERSEYALCEFLLTDAEFELDLAIEFGLAPDHPAAQYIRDGIAEVRAMMEEWGTEEDATQAAEAWWTRIYDKHSRELAAQILEWIDEGAMLNAEEAYWIPPYMTRVVVPELTTFKEKYPDRDGFVALVENAGVNLGAIWSQASAEDAETPCYDWVSKVIPQARDAMAQYVADSLAELETYGKQKVMEEDGEGYPLEAIEALDAARVILSRQPDNETAQKIHDKAMQYVEAFWDEHKFKIEEMVMPEDRMPEDSEIHQAMQAAYASEAAELGWNDQVLRVVVTSPFAEGWEAWWVENVLHVGYFKRITGAVAVKQAEGCSVKRCLFRQQRQDDGTFSNVYLAKVITSYPILEENVNP